MPDERSRMEVSEALAEALGPAAAAALMECIPPFGWHEIATKSDLRALDETFEHRLQAFESRVDAKLSSLKGEFARVEARFDSVEARFDSVEARFEGIEARFEGIEGQVVGIEGRFVGIEGRLVGIDGRFDGLQAQIAGVKGELIGAFHAETKSLVRWLVTTVFAGMAAMGAVAGGLVAVFG